MFEKILAGFVYIFMGYLAIGAIVALWEINPLLPFGVATLSTWMVISFKDYIGD